MRDRRLLLVEAENALEKKIALQENPNVEVCESGGSSSVSHAGTIQC